MSFYVTLFTILFLVAFAFCCFFGKVKAVYKTKNGSEQVEELSLFPTLKIFTIISGIFAILAGLIVIGIVDIVKFLI